MVVNNLYLMQHYWKFIDNTQKAVPNYSTVLMFLQPSIYLSVDLKLAGDLF